MANYEKVGSTSNVIERIDIARLTLHGRPYVDIRKFYKSGPEEGEDWFGTAEGIHIPLHLLGEVVDLLSKEVPRVIEVKLEEEE